jgi:hypothetical protein
MAMGLGRPAVGIFTSSFVWYLACSLGLIGAAVSVALLEPPQAHAASCFALFFSPPAGGLQCLPYPSPSSTHRQFGWW